jgi:hypothetical protein
MKKSNIIWALLMCVANTVMAQSLTVQSAQINFGSVNELNPDSELVVLTNNNSYDVHVTGYHFYTTYGLSAFSTSAGNFTVPSGGNYSIWVKFSPRHNILHNSELVIECDGPKGFARVDLVGQGHYSNSYYNASENLSEEALKTQLKTITGVGYRSLGYSPPQTGNQPCARDTMFMIIDNKKVNGQGATQNTIECVYTGREAVGYVDRTQCQDLTDPNMSFNTEHTWPQSLFSQLEPMRSDMFHLFPTDETANGKRSNYPFGVVTNPTWSNGGSKFDQNSGIFEPRDDHKGETARAMFYFVMRYQNYSNFLNTQESILRQWHYQFLPTTIEQKRCNDIQIYQKNRNPFIDYPQFVDRINSFSTTSVAPVVNTFDLPTDSIQYGLIDASLNNVYKFWIVNNGNAVVNISNLSLNPSSVLSFANGTNANASIQPGEALNIDVNLANAPLGNFNGTLNFTASGTSLNVNKVVPINAYLSLTGLNEVSNEQALRVYPNPTNGQIHWSEIFSGTISITDIEGRIVYSSPLSSATQFDIPESISAGFYTLQLSNAVKVFRAIIVKQ